VLAIIIAGLLGGVALCGCSASGTSMKTGAGGESTTVAATSGDSTLARVFEDHASSREVEGRGTVSKLLSDDTGGDRHQRFIVRLDSGQTLLVTHNIDTAPRVASLGVGDMVAFRGEYEWNDQDGIIHWTHHDPNGSHTAGWIRHNGRTYQ
jgi:hypothetical protein